MVMFSFLGFVPGSATQIDNIIALPPRHGVLSPSSPPDRRPMRGLVTVRSSSSCLTHPSRLGEISNG